MTWETVAVETPASRATSFMRILWGTRAPASHVQPPAMSGRLPPLAAEGKNDLRYVTVIPKFHKARRTSCGFNSILSTEQGAFTAAGAEDTEGARRLGL